MIRTIVFGCLVWFSYVHADARMVRMDTAEAEAVLHILSKRDLGEPITPGDWTRLFATEGYQRLQHREAAMKRAYTDAEFRTFVESDDLLARRAELRCTLDAWRGVDVSNCASAARKYLPVDQPFPCTVYFVIKPKTNSFVFETESDNPAIFMYLDPVVEPAKLANTLTHELHHIGFAKVCPDEEQAESGPVHHLNRWVYAFGEGFAMLAAAGDARTHPHVDSTREERARWDGDMEKLAENLAEVDRFFREILDGSLVDEGQIRKRAFSFYGTQGPWYTVGWWMATRVELHHGRDFLVQRLCEPWCVVAAYQRLAEQQGWPRWSEDVLQKCGAGR
jgi:hypothetical protein